MVVVDARKWQSSGRISCTSAALCRRRRQCPLGQKQLNIAQAETEHAIQPYSMAYDVGGEAMAVVGRAGVFMSQVSLGFRAAARPSIVTMPVAARDIPIVSSIAVGCLVATAPNMISCVFSGRQSFTRLCWPSGNLPGCAVCNRSSNSRLVCHGSASNQVRSSTVTVTDGSGRRRPRHFVSLLVSCARNPFRQSSR